MQQYSREINESRQCSTRLTPDESDARNPCAESAARNQNKFDSILISKTSAISATSLFCRTPTLVTYPITLISVSLSLIHLTDIKRKLCSEDSDTSTGRSAFHVHCNCKIKPLNRSGWRA